MKQNQLYLVALLVISFSWGMAAHSLAQYAFTSINDPLGVTGTEAEDINGNNIVGYYTDASFAKHGFVYNGSSFTSLNYPSAMDTVAGGVSGNDIVGSFLSSTFASESFFYNGSTYQTIIDPVATGGTFAQGISGNNIVGYYDNGSTEHGFLYNGSTYVTLNDPLAGVGGTNAFGIDGTNIVGTYYDANDVSHGFLFNGTTYTTIDDPLAPESLPSHPGTSFGTDIFGISGNNIVGTYQDSSGQLQGFLYNGTTYTNIDDPVEDPDGINLTVGVDGNNVVGTYEDAQGISHGFEATLAVPEPSSLTLLGLGLFGFGLVRVFRAKAQPVAKK